MNCNEIKSGDNGGIDVHSWSENFDEEIGS